MKNNPIILALDSMDKSKASDLLTKVRPHIGMIKIGLEMYSEYGKSSLELGDTFAAPIFLDLKLFDVPTTVGKTVASICRQLAPISGNHFLTVHCMGGKEMCQAALSASQGSNVTIVGVTALTSMDSVDFYNLGMRNGMPGKVTGILMDVGADCNNKHWKYDAAHKRILSGLTHFVCAPTQLPLMRKNYGPDLILITPGIRSDTDEQHDHKRTKSASFAIRNGANWIVIGRPITEAVDPLFVTKSFETQLDRIRNG